MCSNMRQPLILQLRKAHSLISNSKDLLDMCSSGKGCRSISRRLVTVTCAASVNKFFMALSVRDRLFGVFFCCPSSMKYLMSLFLRAILFYSRNSGAALALMTVTYSVSQKRSPIQLFAIFSLLVNLRR